MKRVSGLRTIMGTLGAGARSPGQHGNGPSDDGRASWEVSRGTSGLIDILVVEDNPADARLIFEAFAHAPADSSLHLVRDGEKALSFLRRQGPFETAPRPELILLDLNLPRLSGHEVLDAVKSDPDLRSIPIVILTTSEAKRDIVESYKRQANCFVTKPVDLDRFLTTIQALDKYWLSTVHLPPVGA